MSEGLPRPGAASLAELKRFDLRVGLPVTWSLLRERVGRLKALRVLAAVVTGGLRDPLAELPAGDWPPAQETLVRHQLRQAVLLDDATRTVLDWEEDARLALVREIVSTTGGHFVGANVPLPTIEGWRAADNAARRGYLEALTARLFNARVVGIEVEAQGLEFNVEACRFVQLCEALGRPYLVPMFCAADSVYFDRAESPVALERAGTLAQGASRCDFHFRLRKPAPAP